MLFPEDYGFKINLRAQFLKWPLGSSAVLCKPDIPMAKRKKMSPLQPTLKLFKLFHFVFFLLKLT